jgi:hypothetical protein
MIYRRSAAVIGLLATSVGAAVLPPPVQGSTKYVHLPLRPEQLGDDAAQMLKRTPMLLPALNGGVGYPVSSKSPHLPM